MERKRREKGEKLRLKEYVWIVCQEIFFEVFCPVSEVESVGNSVDLSSCVFASLSVVLVVTVLFSDVNLACEVVFFDSDCERVEPQTSLSRKREAIVACETGPPVKAVLEAVRNRPTPQSGNRMRNRAPPPPEGTSLQIRPTSPGPSSLDCARKVVLGHIREKVDA